MNIIVTTALKTEILKTINECSDKRYHLVDIRLIVISRKAITVEMTDEKAFELHPNVLWDLEYE